MKLHAVIALSVLLFSCSVHKQTNSEIDETVQDNNTEVEEKSGPPSWLNDPMAACLKDRELCAVGEGTGAIVAELAARKSLARVFESKIQSSTTVSQKTTQESDADSIISGKNLEYVENQIDEVIDQVLQGVEVKKIYRSTEMVYTLVSLDKYEAAKRIRAEIQDIDQKMQTYYQEKTRSAYFRLMKQFSIREKLAQRYLFVSGTTLPQIVTFEQIQGLKKELANNPMSVRVEFLDKSKLKEFTSQVSKMLLDYQYKVITDKERPVDYIVSGSISGDKQHLNVEGFERYKFLITLNATNKTGEKVGGLKFETTKTGRSLKHAYENALLDISQYIEEHFNELNID